MRRSVVGSSKTPRPLAIRTVGRARRTTLTSALTRGLAGAVAAAGVAAWGSSRRAERAADARARAALVAADAAGVRAERLGRLAADLVAATTPTDVAHAFVAGAGVAFGALGGILAELVEPGDRLQPLATWGLSPGVDGLSALDIARSVVGAACSSGDMILVPDLHAAAERFPDTMTRIGSVARSAVAIPLRAGHSLIGAVALHFAGELTLDNDDTTTLRAMADQCGLAIDRARLFERHVAEQQRLASVLEQLPSGVLVVGGHAGEVLLANEAALRLLAGTEATSLSLSGDAGVSGRAAALDGPISEALAGSRVIAREALINLPDGSQRRLRANAGPLVEQGQRVGAIVAFEDVTVGARNQLTLQLLARLGSVLARSATLADTVGNGLSVCCPHFADRCSVYLRQGDGSLRHVRTVGEPTDGCDDGGPGLDEAALVPARVARTGRPERLPAAESGAGANPAALPAPAVLVVPLQGSSSVLGALVFELTSSGRRYAPADLDVAERLAEPFAAAVERHRTATAAEGLQRVGAALSAAATPEEVHAIVVQAPGDLFGAACVLLLASEAAAPRDDDHRPLRVVTAGGSAAALASSIGEGEARLLNDAPDLVGLLASGAHRFYQEAKAIKEELPSLGLLCQATGAQAGVVLPLGTGTGGVAGLLLGWTRPRIFTAEERARKLTFADLVAQALTRAELFARQRTIAETLQHSLMPDSLPDIPGIDLAATYGAGAPEVDVGGDWYDVLSLDATRSAVVIGDVAGRGMPAATAMAQLRNAVRAFAHLGQPPIELIELLNRFALRVPGGTMATVCYAVINPVAREVVYVTAGHPPPLVVAPDGSTSWLEGAICPPVGVYRRYQARAATARLAPGSTIVFYTDGLVERRDRDLGTGLGLLADAAAELAGEAGLTPTGLIDGLVARLAPPGEQVDDLAIVVAHLAVPPKRLVLTLPAAIDSPARWRGHLRAWLAVEQLDDQATFDIVAATAEAVANAAVHAYPATGGTIWCEAARDEGGNGDIVVTVRDQGRWRTGGGRSSGRGVRLMHDLLETDIRHGPEGTTVTLRYRRPVATT